MTAEDPLPRLVADQSCLRCWGNTQKKIQQTTVMFCHYIWCVDIYTYIYIWHLDLHGKDHTYQYVIICWWVYFIYIYIILARYPYSIPLKTSTHPKSLTFLWFASSFKSAGSLATQSKCSVNPPVSGPVRSSVPCCWSTVDSFGTCDAELCKFSASFLTPELQNFQRHPCTLLNLNMAEPGVFFSKGDTWNHASAMTKSFRKWAPSSSGYPKFRKHSNGSNILGVSCFNLNF